MYSCLAPSNISKHEQRKSADIMPTLYADKNISYADILNKKSLKRIYNKDL